MSRYIFDIESNGFLDKLTTIHCICLHDLTDETTSTYRSDIPGSIEAGLARLESADELVGHNIIDYDIPALQKVYPEFNPRGKSTDTLIISRLVYPNVKDRDFTRKPKDMPLKFYGSHGLEAWGHRLGYHKGDYAKEMKERGLDPWAEVNDDMVDYCELDVQVNLRLLELLMKSGFSQESMDLEHAAHYICKAQMKYGSSFDEDRAQQLYLHLNQEKWKVEEELQKVFQPWEVHEEFIPKRDNRKLGYKKGVPFIKTKVIEFNPASRDHIGQRLVAIRGWKPEAYGSNGKPTVDEGTLKDLPYPEIPTLLRYLMLNKRIGQLAEGKEAWLKLVKDDGRIYGRINPNAAITGRATHSKPNLAQVPAVRSPFGGDCRSLFRATPGRVLIGADASGLELRLFAHYLAHYDGGAYAKLILEGDIHTANQKAAGLPTRDDAKTFIYALLYGAGNAKIGSIIHKGPKAGAILKKRFIEAIPAYGKLLSGVKKAAQKRGRIRSLDGRYLWVRHEFAALNTLLQGAGAVVMKQAMVNYHRILEDKDIPFDQVFWVHDEYQTECDPEYAEIVGEAMVEGIRMTTQQFNLGCPLDGEYKVGANWAETH